MCFLCIFVTSINAFIFGFFYHMKLNISAFTDFFVTISSSCKRFSDWQVHQRWIWVLLFHWGYLTWPQVSQYCTLYPTSFLVPKRKSYFYIKINYESNALLNAVKQIIHLLLWLIIPQFIEKKQINAQTPATSLLTKATIWNNIVVSQNTSTLHYHRAHLSISLPGGPTPDPNLHWNYLIWWHVLLHYQITSPSYLAHQYLSLHWYLHSFS